MFNNLLNSALSVIPHQQATLLKFKSMTSDPFMGSVAEYYPPQQISGSWQSADTQAIHEMGLDITKHYRQFYTSTKIEDVQRGTMPDQLVYGGKKYTVMGDSDWYEQDGWNSIICIEERHDT